jgi:hypothetical protein
MHWADSSALITKYTGCSFGRLFIMKFHLRWVENPAPPHPLKPDFHISSVNFSDPKSSNFSVSY